MNVYEALDMISMYDAKVLIGQEGLNRSISSVEVMEVPQIEEWITPNTLILTTMYSIKDDPQSQNELIKTLINNEASGIIVKLGRFVERLPEKAIRLAEERNFPIIILPVNIHFYKVLNILIKNLETPMYQNEFDKIQGSSYENVYTLMNDIYHSFKIVTYVESFHGELLFSGSYRIKDIWRDEDNLYSTPKLANALHYIEQIHQKYKKYKRHSFYRVDELSRIIIPLFSQGSVYGLLHVVYRNATQKKMVLNPNIFILVDKIHVSLMSEMIGIQNQKIYREELFQNWRRDNSTKLLVHIILNKPEKEERITTLFDPVLLARKQIEKMFVTLQGVTNYYIVENEEGFIGLLSFMETNFISTENIRLVLEEHLLQSMIPNAFIAISSPFVEVNDIEDRANSVMKIIDIGKRIYPEKQVFSFNKLGIYTFLLKLSNDSEVLDYVDSILKPLKELDETLIKTLKTYIELNGNASQTAKNLYMNRRTITYHLKKIQEICEWDLNDAETIFILQFCLHINELK